MSPIYDFQVKTIEGKNIDLQSFKGKTLLVVNVASACGLTPQYKGLQKLQNELSSHNFTVLGFPCNQFGAQEPGTDAEIQQFCSARFEVGFPLFSKIEVNGPSAHPLYRHLKKSKQNGEGKEDITWNFEKFLIDKEGVVVERFDPKVEPEALRSRIEAVL